MNAIFFPVSNQFMKQILFPEVQKLWLMIALIGCS